VSWTWARHSKGSTNYKTLGSKATMPHADWDILHLLKVFSYAPKVLLYYFSTQSDNVPLTSGHSPFGRIPFPMIRIIIQFPKQYSSFPLLGSGVRAAPIFDTGLQGPFQAVKVHWKPSMLKIPIFHRSGHGIREVNDWIDAILNPRLLPRNAWGRPSIPDS